MRTLAVLVYLVAWAFVIFVPSPTQAAVYPSAHDGLLSCAIVREAQLEHVSIRQIYPDYRTCQLWQLSLRPTP